MKGPVGVSVIGEKGQGQEGLVRWWGCKISGVGGMPSRDQQHQQRGSELGTRQLL